MSTLKELEDQVELLEAAIADTNRRFAASERRHAKQVEAIAVEMKRLEDRIPRRPRAAPRSKHPSS